MFSKTISLSLKLVMQMTLGGLTISLRVLFCGVMIAGSMLCFLRGLRILLTRGAGKGGRSVAVSNLFTSIYPQSVTRIVTYKKKRNTGDLDDPPCMAFRIPVRCFHHVPWNCRYIAS